MSKSLKTFFIILFIGFQMIAQNKENRWVIGAGVGITKFSSKDANFSGDKFNFQIPKINTTRYFFNGFSLDASLAASTFKSFPGIEENNVIYLTVDLGVKYDFNLSNKNFVPYALFGVSFINVSSLFTPTLNVGGGGTFWLNSNYGINLQLSYKVVSDTNPALKSHGYLSIGGVYSFKPRRLIQRLWN